MITYPDLQTILQRTRVTGENHFKIAWANAHNMKVEDVTEEQAKECAFVYYTVLSQAVLYRR